MTIKRRRGDATIRATFDVGVMMFGTSYRKWWDQLGEFSRLSKCTIPTIVVSTAPWIGYGGLKWCLEEEFQNQLDQEGEGRNVSDFNFRPPNLIELNCLRSVFPTSRIK